MSDEVKVVEEKTCFCKSEGFKKFLVISLGTFAGGFCALNLFAVLHKPKMPPMPMMHRAHSGYHHMMNHPMKMHNYDCPFHKKMMKKNFENKVEFLKKMEEKKLEKNY